jgi:holo-[acyl-carrier protein] synthase
MIIGIGVDMIWVRDVREALAHYGNQYTDEIFTAEERNYCESTADPAQRYAARFAAKEACMKAFGTGWGNGVGWTEIAICNLPSGAPTLALSGTAKAMAETRGVKTCHVSLTHTRDLAMAEVLLESN